MSLWRVTITQTVGRRVWHHEYAVLAETEAEAKAKAIEHFHVADGDLYNIEAEVDYDGIIKSGTRAQPVRRRA
jgi:hypothetical protein